MPLPSSSSSNSMESFKKLILEMSKISKEDMIAKNRNLTYENGFIDGIASSTLILLECLADTEDTSELEIGLEGFHRAAHLLFGENLATNGICKFLSAYDKTKIFRIIERGLEQVGLPVVKVKVGEKESPRKPN